MYVSFISEKIITLFISEINTFLFTPATPSNSCRIKIVKSHSDKQYIAEIDLGKTHIKQENNEYEPISFFSIVRRTFWSSIQS